MYCTTCEQDKDPNEFFDNPTNPKNLNKDSKCKVCRRRKKATRLSYWKTRGLCAHCSLHRPICPYSISLCNQCHIVMKEYSWRAQGIKNFTYSDYVTILELQGYACALCKSTTKTLVMDHNHTTGTPRAAVCQNCNMQIGIYETNRHKIIKYLNAYDRR